MIWGGSMPVQISFWLGSLQFGHLNEKEKKYVHEIQVLVGTKTTK